MVLASFREDQRRGGCGQDIREMVRSDLNLGKWLGFDFLLRASVFRDLPGPAGEQRVHTGLWVIYLIISTASINSLCLKPDSSL
jgi:hypothetical protein